jgi:hypothetical protein
MGRRMASIGSRESGVPYVSVSIKTVVAVVVVGVSATVAGGGMLAMGRERR